MIYNTTITGGGGGIWYDDRGNMLTAVGNQNIYIGKNVYTDGKVIYGYDMPSTMQKPKRSAIARNESVIFGFTGFVNQIPADNGKVKGIIPKDYQKEYANDVFNGVFNEGNSVCANRPIIAGSRLYNFYHTHDGSTGLYTLQEIGGETINLGYVYNQSRGFDSYYCFDAGRNGGFGICIECDNGFNIRYSTPEHNLYNVTRDNLASWAFDTGLFSATPTIDSIANLNIDDTGNLSFSFRAYDTSVAYLLTLYVYTNGSRQLYGYYPVCGDGIGNFNFNTGMGAIRYTINDTTITLSAHTTEKLTLTKKYAFLHKFNGMGRFLSQTPDGSGWVKQYDVNTGTLLREYGTDFQLNEYVRYKVGYGNRFPVDAISNTRLDFVDFYKWLKRYNYM